MTTENGMRKWQEEIEEQVTQALSQRKVVSEPGAEGSDAAVEAPQETAKRQVKLGGEYTYVGELEVAATADPMEMFAVCNMLKTRLGSDILYISHSKRGAKITCSVPDPARLIASLKKMPIVYSWALVQAQVSAN